jgi:hypothetical protein
MVIAQRRQRKEVAREVVQRPVFKEKQGRVRSIQIVSQPNRERTSLRVSLIKRLTIADGNSLNYFPS